MNAWLALVVTDVVAVTTFARCFTGPGELTAALVSLVLVHLLGLAARGGPSALRVGAQTGQGGVDDRAGRRAEPGRDHSRRGRRLRSACWVFGLVVGVFLPIGIVLGPGFFWVGPGQATWHALFKDVRAAWAAFSFRLAPVPELPGLVLATAWAAAAAGLLAELISSKRRIPAAFALTPAVGLYLFASALGTDSGRVPGLAAMAGSACWYLVAVVREREQDRDVIVASPDAGLKADERATPHRAGAFIFPMAALAALSAAVIGPNLPGARSVALVSWHGTRGFSTGTGPVVPGSGPPQGVEINTLVQVAEAEVDDPSVALFTVHSRLPTREMMAALDEFNGDSWSATASASSTTLRSFSAPLASDARRPPLATPDGSGRKRLVQVFEVSGLGGHSVPSWGYPLAASDPDAGRVRWEGWDGSILSGALLQRGTVYAVESVVADPSPAQLEADPVDISNLHNLQLPQPVPARVVELAKRLVAGATTPYQEALDLDAYLTSPRFHYRLPQLTGSGPATPSSGYGELLSFLFRSRTGYCQQFATAFAVLARVDGLPTRIAVGFLPGAPVGNGAWQVDGTDTHAWPQVRFQKYGWIDFEPTPGTSVKGSSAPVLPATASTTTASVFDPDDLGRRSQPHPCGERWSDHARSWSTSTPRRIRRPLGTLAPRSPCRAARVGRRARVVEAAAVAASEARRAGGSPLGVERSSRDP